MFENDVKTVKLKKKNDRSKKWREKRKNEGKCVNCGKEKEQEDKASCNRCLDNHRNSGRMRRLKRKAEGLCDRCGKKALEGRCMCAPCLEFNNTQTKARTKKRKESGLCTSCGKPNEDQQYSLCENCKEKVNENTLMLKLQVMCAYGGECVCCGDDFIHRLTIDHINGGGYQHRQVVGHGSQFYKYLVDENFPEEYRVLCASCNLCHHLNNGNCPH